MRNKFNKDLHQLLDNVNSMGKNLEATLDKVITNLDEQDSKLAQNIINNDDNFDNDEVKIERQCLELILTQTPVATDYREIASCLKLVGDMERIADHCSDISQYTLHLTAKEKIELPEDFYFMIKVMRQMVTDALTAIKTNNVEMAQAVIASDDLVDEYFYTLRQEFTNIMQENTDLVPQYVDYLMITKYIERIADHSTNIAQWVLFIVKNELSE